MLTYCVQMIKYWRRIKTDHLINPLLIKSFPIYIKGKEDLGEHSCLSTVKFLLDYRIWLNATKIKNETIASKCCNILMSKYVGYWNKMLQNTDSSSLKKEKSNIYTHGTATYYCLIKSEYRLEAYLTFIADRTNR